MVLIGQTIQTYKGLECEHVIKFAKTLGIESGEINPQGVNLKNVNQIIDVLNGMKTTFHLPVAEIDGFDFSFTESKKEIDGVIKLLNNYGEKLNIILAVFHPVEIQGDYETLVNNLKQLKIPLVVENIFHMSDEDFIEYYKKLKEELGSQLKGWLFDVAHSYLLNGPDNYMDLLDKMPFDELEEIHLSDCTEGEDSHYSFGAGVLPVNEILKKIKRKGFRKIVVNEISAYPSIWSTVDSYRKAARYFKKSLFIKVAFRKLLMKPLIQSKLKKAGIS